jgi:hypothetical protein
MGCPGHVSGSLPRAHFRWVIFRSTGQVLMAVTGVAIAAAGEGVGICGLRWAFATYLRTERMSVPANKRSRGRCRRLRDAGVFPARTHS